MSKSSSEILPAKLGSWSLAKTHRGVPPLRMDALTLVKLPALMQLTSGRPEITIGLIDGPIFMDHPGLASNHIHEVAGRSNSACTHASSIACTHGTFVAGILSAKRDSPAPAICPNCNLLVRPIFTDTTADTAHTQLPSATPSELAMAIIECIEAGSHVLNLSAALTQASSDDEHELEQTLNYAAKRGVIIVAAAGNQGTLGSSTITRHPWVIPVGACDSHGRPLIYSNLGSSIGRRGLSAPGEGVTSLGVDGNPLTMDGTSAAAPFVTGTIALLWAEFPHVTATEVKYAVTQAAVPRRTTVVPPVLDAWGAYEAMRKSYSRR